MSNTKKKKNTMWLRCVLEYLSKKDIGSKSYSEIINEAHLCSIEKRHKVLRQSRICPQPRQFQQAIRKVKEIESLVVSKTTLYRYVNANEMRGREKNAFL